MIRTGEVIERIDGGVAVEFDRPTACEHCHGCANGDCKRTRVELSVGPSDDCEVNVGDTVDVELPDRRVVQASALAYIVPLVLLLAGLFAGSALYGALGIAMSRDLFAALCGLALMMVGGVAVVGIDRSLRGSAGWEPRIVRVHNNGR